MSGLLRWVLAFGAEPEDSEDTRLKKVLLLVAALVITPLAVLWGAIYWMVGASDAAAIPWLYVVISLASLVSFGRTRSYRWFAIGQFAPYVTMPFVLMWILGGFVAGSVVAVWASLAPITARPHLGCIARPRSGPHRTRRAWPSSSQNQLGGDEPA